MSKLIILAAGIGMRLRPLTLDKPKCLVEIHGKSILDWLIDIAHHAGIQDIVVVKGYQQGKVQRDGVRFYINNDYESTNMVSSLWCAESELEKEVIISYGDILYEIDVMKEIMRSSHDIAVAVDKGWQNYWEKRFDNPLSDAESLQVDNCGRILSIGQTVYDISEIQGQFIGLLKFSEAGINTLKKVYYRLLKESKFGEQSFRSNRTIKNIFMTDLLQGVITAGYEIYEIPITRKWLEIDSLLDHSLAHKLAKLSNNGILSIV